MCNPPSYSSPEEVARSASEKDLATYAVSIFLSDSAKSDNIDLVNGMDLMINVNMLPVLAQALLQLDNDRSHKKNRRHTIKAGSLQIHRT